MAAGPAHPAASSAAAASPFDPDFATWRACGNHYWPAIDLVDKRGHVRLVKRAEGGYDETEAAIRALLAEPG